MGNQKNETGQWVKAQYGQKNQGETPYEQGGACQESRDLPLTVDTYETEKGAIIYKGTRNLSD